MTTVESFIVKGRKDYKFGIVKLANLQKFMLIERKKNVIMSNKINYKYKMLLTHMEQMRRINFKYLRAKKKSTITITQFNGTKIKKTKLAKKIVCQTNKFVCFKKNKIVFGVFKVYDVSLKTKKNHFAN